MSTTTAPLTQEEKRIKIAEACGWQQVDQRGGEPFAWKNPSIGLGNGGYLPDYFNDLNAMHEAEMQHFDILVKGQYWLVLSDTMDNGLQVGHWPATATQHAEAFGKTLNLW